MLVTWHSHSFRQPPKKKGRNFRCQLTQTVPVAQNPMATITIGGVEFEAEPCPDCDGSGVLATGLRLRVTRYPDDGPPIEFDEQHAPGDQCPTCRGRGLMVKSRGRKRQVRDD